MQNLINPFIWKDSTILTIPRGGYFEKYKCFIPKNEALFIFAQIIPVNISENQLNILNRLLKKKYLKQTPRYENIFPTVKMTLASFTGTYLTRNINFRHARKITFDLDFRSDTE